jgi:hypothetical protein
MQAPESLLTPNLHVAICRGLRQEKQRGPTAADSEWFMERCASHIPIRHTFLEQVHQAELSTLAAGFSSPQKATVLE